MGSFRHWPSLAVATLLLCAPLAQAQTATYRFDLPGQPLADALRAIGQQTHKNVVFDPAVVEGISVPSLRAQLSVTEAMSKLLSGTALTIHSMSPDTIVVERVKSGGGPAGSRVHDSGDASPPQSSRTLMLAANDPPGGLTQSDQTGASHADATAVQPVDQLDEVVVTAEKRSERLLDVPMSVTAISGEQLRTAGIGSTLDLQQVTPGLVTTNNGLGFSPSIRGVSSAGTTPGDEANVAIYLDDVYIGAPTAGFFDLKDIEDVEVLKGPQGTLFGRNATGGAIRISTRAPSFTPDANVSADYGFNFREVDLGAYATGPITDSIAASVSGSDRNGEGFVEGVGPVDAGRHYARPDNYVYRGKVLFKPSEIFQATLAGDVSQTQNNAVFLASPQDNVNPYPRPGSVANTTLRYAGSTQPEALVKGHSFSLDATWDPVNWMTARSISAYRVVDGTYRADLDRTSLSINALSLAQNQQNFSQEFNFSSPSNQSIVWLLGAYYYHSNAGNPYFTVDLGDAPGGTPASNFTDTVITDSYAGFGDVTWNATSQLHFTGGARYSTETKDYSFRALIPAGSPAKTSEASWDSPTFRGVVRYDLATDANVYASWSDGFKSGVYNAYSPLAIPVSPEKIDAIEIGAKARLSGITFTAAAYDYEYKDLQVQTHDSINGAIVTTLTNAGRAKMRGMELTADGHVIDQLSFDAGVSWLPTATYTSYQGASVVLPCPTCALPVVGVANTNYNASGSRMIKAPVWTTNLRLTYSAPLLEGLFAATVSDAYNPGFYWQPGDLTRERSYNLTNARLSWTDPRHLFTYSVWSTNLTNALYSTYTSANVLSDSESYAQPRQIGIGLALKL
jgi:iron complex outermembrane receptor protein